MQPVLYDAGLSSNPNPVARVSNGKDGCVHMCPIKNNFEKKTLNKSCFAGSQSPCCNLRPGHRVSLQYVCFFYWKYSCCLCDWIGLRYICRAQKTHLKFTTYTSITKWSMSIGMLDIVQHSEKVWWYWKCTFSMIIITPTSHHWPSSSPANTVKWVVRQSVKRRQ